MGRDLTICPDGTIKANLIIALCITCEKKIIVPVQLWVLSTGFVQISPQVSAICTSFPQLFPDQIDDEEEDEEECGRDRDIRDEDCCPPRGRSGNFPRDGKR
jgi:hypothetical protein